MKRLLTFFAASALVAAATPARAEFPTLDVAIQRARQQSLIVHDALSEVGVANAQLVGSRVSALGNFYSEVQVDRPFTHNAENEAGRKVQAMTFNYLPVDIFGQRGKRIDEAERLIDWKKQGLIDAQALAMGDVVAAYGELIVSSSRVSAAATGEVTAREEAKYFQGRFDAKDTTLYEKSIAEAEVARWVQTKAEAALRVANTRARFGELTGNPDPETPPPDLNAMPPALKANWDDAQVARVIEKSPLIARYAAEKNYWDASVSRYEREAYPPVTFEAIAGRGSQGELRLGGGAIITFPITRRYQGEIARAESGRLHAAHHLEIYRGVINARLRSARDAFSAVTVALAELDKNGMPALERAVTASMEGFRAGKIDLSRALLARRDLAVARARRLDLIEAAWRAYADLVIFSGELP